MLIPSIDLMDGKIVQLVKGEHKALEFDNFAEWVRRLRDFPMVQLIDLNAAMDAGDNRQLVERFCAELPCQVGGGLRDLERVGRAIAVGAKKAIVGSSLFLANAVNIDFAGELANQFGTERLIAAVDSRAGVVAIKGWKQSTCLRPADAMRQLENYCSAFLYTHIDSEGSMQGFPLGVLQNLLSTTRNRLIVAGGIACIDEVEHLAELGIDAVVGMAIYTQAIAI